MGLSAELIAIGPFSGQVVPVLEHDAVRYEGTLPGTRVVSSVLQAGGSSTSREMAAACGVEAWNFAQHRLDPRFIDLIALERVGESLGVEGVANTVRVLEEARFEFYFLPNG